MNVFKAILATTFLLVLSQQLSAEKLSLQGAIIDNQDGRVIFNPCFCVKGVDCRCMPETPDISFSIPDHFLENSKVIESNGEKIYDIVVDEDETGKIKIDLSIPVSAADLQKRVTYALDDNAKVDDVPIIENNANVSFALNRQAEIWRLPGNCSDGNCTCYLDGNISTCAFVASCLDAGWCYYAKTKE